MQWFTDNLLLLDKIADGGMGEVFRARYKGIGGFEKTVAVKRILPNIAQVPEFKAMFLRETQLCAQLQHPNIVQTFSNGEKDGFLYLVMEFVRGKTLAEIINRCNELGHVLPLGLCMLIIEEAAKGLGFAHQLRDESTDEPLKIVHRDISPQNVMVGYGGNVKVLDFGVAKAANSSDLTQTGAIKGKEAYLSPEQVDGTPLDCRSDIFSLSIIAAELISGNKLFEAETTLQTLLNIKKGILPPMTYQGQQIDPELEALFKKGLQVSKDERYQLATDLSRAIARYRVDNFANADGVMLSSFMRGLFEKEIQEEKKILEAYASMEEPPSIIKNSESKKSEPIKSASSQKPSAKAPDRSSSMKRWDSSELTINFEEGDLQKPKELGKKQGLVKKPLPAKTPSSPKAVSKPEQKPRPKPTPKPTPKPKARTEHRTRTSSKQKLRKKPAASLKLDANSLNTGISQKQSSSSSSSSKKGTPSLSLDSNLKTGKKSPNPHSKNARKATLETRLPLVFKGLILATIATPILATLYKEIFTMLIGNSPANHLANAISSQGVFSSSSASGTGASLMGLLGFTICLSSLLPMIVGSIFGRFKLVKKILISSLVYLSLVAGILALINYSAASRLTAVPSLQNSLTAVATVEQLFDVATLSPTIVVLDKKQIKQDIGSLATSRSLTVDISPENHQKIMKKSFHRVSTVKTFLGILTLGYLFLLVQFISTTLYSKGRKAVFASRGAYTILGSYAIFCLTLHFISTAVNTRINVGYSFFGLLLERDNWEHIIFIWTLISATVIFLFAKYGSRQ